MSTLHLSTVSKQTTLNVVQTGRSWHQFGLWLSLRRDEDNIILKGKEYYRYCLLLRCTSTARSSSPHIVNVSKINRVIWVAVVIVIVDRFQIIF